MSFLNGFNPYAGCIGDDIPNDPGKMFIGGLSWQTTPESIREYFSSFGDLAEVMVMKDPATRRSRGFGFITFSDPHAVDKVLKYPVHQLDGKLVEPKVAVPRKTNPKLVMRTKKIFVGGLSSTTSLEDIRAYFDQFSKVKEAMLAYDKVTNRHRGFGFVTFDNEDVVDKICEIHFHEINGKMVESKKALPKEPRLGYYSQYSTPFYGGNAGGPTSPPHPQGSKSLYGSAYQGNLYNNGNRYFPQQHFQNYYDRMNNSTEKTSEYNNDYSSPSSGGGHNPGFFNDSDNGTNMMMMRNNQNYSKNINNMENSHQGQPGIRNQEKFKSNYSVPDSYNDFDFFNSRGSGSYSGSGGGDNNSGGVYEDDFPELTAAKFSQLRLEAPLASSQVPSSKNTNFCF